MYGARHLVTATFAQWQIWLVSDTCGRGGGVNKGVISQLMVSGSRLFMALQLRVNTFLY